MCQDISVIALNCGILRQSSLEKIIAGQSKYFKQTNESTMRVTIYTKLRFHSIMTTCWNINLVQLRWECNEASWTVLNMLNMLTLHVLSLPWISALRFFSCHVSSKFIFSCKVLYLVFSTHTHTHPCLVIFLFRDWFCSKHAGFQYWWIAPYLV